MSNSSGMIATFWGLRGSYPTTESAFNRYGGRTPCVSFTKVVDGEVHRIIVDSGTGIIPLGKQLVEEVEASEQPYHIYLLLTHYHMDHIQGLPFFAPIHHPNAVIHIYGMNLGKVEVQRILGEHVSGATFPVPYDQMRSVRLHYTIFDRSTFPIGPFMIDVMRASAIAHPSQGCLYFRITDRDTNKSVCCVWDHEAKDEESPITEFIKDANVLIHDTHYTSAQYMGEDSNVKGFGHSTFSMAMNIAKRAGVKDKLVCFHYNPELTDDDLDDIKAVRKLSCPIDMIFPHQGMELEI